MVLGSVHLPPREEVTASSLPRDGGLSLQGTFCPAQPWNSAWSGLWMTSLAFCGTAAGHSRVPVVIGNPIFKCFPQHSQMVRSASADSWGDQGHLKTWREGGGHSPEGYTVLLVGFHLNRLPVSPGDTFLGSLFQGCSIYRHFLGINLSLLPNLLCFRLAKEKGKKIPRRILGHSISMQI